MTRRQVIIDTDPGLDDAVAILLALASGRLTVLGLTTLAGNIGLAITTRNAGRLLAVQRQRDIPVIAGAMAPLTRTGRDEIAVHGEDGLGGVQLPEPLAPPRTDAVAWMARMLMAQPTGSIDVLALGPLTNIARLVREHPDAASRIGRLVVMGGAIDEPGNAGGRAEFNFASDPEAAEIVFAAGLKLTLIPLDVTRQFRAMRADVAELEASKSPPAKVAGAMIAAYFQTATLRESRPLHDPLVVLFRLAPELFGVEQIGLSIDLGDGPDAGALNRDPAGHRVEVALRIDADAAMALLKKGLGA
jgi:purine nucleosidase